MPDNYAVNQHPSSLSGQTSSQVSCSSLSAVESDPWQIERLIKLAFKRTKERFISYFLAYVLSIVMVIVGFVGTLIFGGILFGVFLLIRLPILGIILGTIFSFCFIFILAYISIWSQLATVGILITKDKMGVIEVFRRLKPYVLGYLWFSLLYLIFFIGLLPIGFLTLSIVLILWSFWSGFTVFVYLTQKGLRGLDYLWISRNMINQRFWGIVGRILLINFALIFVNFLLIGSRNSLLGLGSIVFSLISAPFAICFNYEIYRLLKRPAMVEKPKAWIWLSVIGWILLLIAIIFLFSHLDLANLLSPLKYIRPPSKSPPYPSLPSYPPARTL